MAKPSRHLTIVLFVCMVSWALWLLVLIFMAPEDLLGFSVILFLLTLTLSLFASFLLLFYCLRIKFLKLRPAYRQFHIIFRESLLMSGLVVSLLILQLFNLFSLSTFLLLVILFFLFDMFFIINYDQRFHQKVR